MANLSVTVPVREYSKEELRAILSNPSIDVNQPNWCSSSTRKQSKRNFYAEVHPVIEKFGKNVISLDDFKARKIVPRNVVALIFSKLL